MAGLEVVLVRLMQDEHHRFDPRPSKVNLFHFDSEVIPFNPDITFVPLYQTLNFSIVLLVNILGLCIGCIQFVFTN
jgi:hypothetical protein